MADLQIHTRGDGDQTVLALAGEFDMAGIQQFEAAIADVEAAGPKTIVIDLTALEFMDSSGLRSLVMADERAGKAGRRLAIVPGPPQIRRVFEITQLEGRLDLVDAAPDVG